MDTNVHKQAIAKVVGLQVGERDGVWVVKDSAGWRELSAEENTMVDTEYSILFRDSMVPKSITSIQGLLAIDAAGMSSMYEAWANDPVRTFAERAFINKAQTWNRDDPTLLAAATAFNLTSEQIDNMFIMGATL